MNRRIRSRPPSRRRLHWGVGLVVGVCLTGALAGSAAFARARYLPDSVVLPGLTVDGQGVAASATVEDVHAAAERRVKARGARTVRFTMADGKEPVLVTTLDALGFKADVDGAVETALRIGKSGDLLGRATVARDARQGRIDVPIAFAIDRDVALSVFGALKETVDTQPVSARLDLDKHETIAERDGRYVDADAAIAQVEAAMLDPNAKEIAIELPVQTFAPRISSAFLKNLEIGTVLAEYETYFGRAGDQQKRGKNIDNAAQKLDGLVISPGELVSFNQVIGERSEANGFQKSWEIFKGEMVEGVGGGTCQVASTFHAATFFGGFDVLERLPHSRPSAYIPMGLDSTVVYPGVDLKVRNPHPFPVVVHAKTEGNKLRVELLGKMRPVDVSFGRELVATISYKRKIVEEPSLAGKKVLVKQHGIKGYRIKRSRILKYPDGTSKKEEATDFYPPTTEIYHVPVGFDVALLPALPAGEGEDESLGGNPSPAPAEAKTPSQDPSPKSATACADCNNESGVEFVNGPGAHAPTAAQKEPPKTMWLRH